MVMYNQRTDLVFCFVRFINTASISVGTAPLNDALNARSLAEGLC